MHLVLTSTVLTSTVLTSTVLAAAPHFAHPALGVGFGLFFIIGHIFWFLVIVALIIGIATRRRRWARAGFGPWGQMGHWGAGQRGAGHWAAGYPGAGHPGAGHGGPAAFWASQQATRAAETTLAERFAQGDIDEKEYRARLEVLRANTSQPPMGPEAPTP